MSAADDTALGRPPRHERARRSSQLAQVDMARIGEGRSVRIRGRRRCGCGAAVDVDFSGPEDSLGVMLAQRRLATPKCEDCEAVQEREEERVEREALRARLVEQRVRASGLPEPRHGLTFDRLDKDAERAMAIEKARRWAAGELPGLVLHGPVGRGKTVLAAAATVAIAQHRSVRWLPVAELLLDLRMPFSSREYVRGMRRLEDAGKVALVLDDLDKLKPSEHAIQPLYVAINRWVEARLPLLVTLNRSLDELAEWCGETFGEPIASRLAGYCDVERVGGVDRRVA